MSMRVQFLQLAVAILLPPAVIILAGGSWLAMQASDGATSQALGTLALIGGGLWGLDIAAMVVQQGWQSLETGTLDSAE